MMDRLLDRQKDEGKLEDFMLEHFHYPSVTFDTSSLNMDNYNN